MLAGHCERLGRDRSEITVSYLASVCVAPTHEQAVAELEQYLVGKPEMVVERSRGGLVGTPDELGEKVAELLASGIDGIVVNAPANGHVDGRVSLLAEALSPLVTR